jgi:hypothetical protein
LIYNAKNKGQQKVDVLAFLAEKQFNRVLDIGGILDPWARQFVTHYADQYSSHIAEINDPTSYDEKLINSGFFQLDIADPDTWEEISKDVAEFGKFDFSLCCHCLEHVIDPRPAIKFITSFCNQGLISVPAKYVELELGNQFGEEGLERCGVVGFWRGCHCHRWILSMQQNFVGDYKLMFWPKLNILEFLKGLDDWVSPVLAEGSGDLSFWWKDDISFCVITDELMDDVNPETTCEIYRHELRKGL